MCANFYLKRYLLTRFLCLSLYLHKKNKRYEKDIWASWDQYKRCVCSITHFPAPTDTIILTLPWACTSGVGAHTCHIVIHQTVSVAHSYILPTFPPSFSKMCSFRRPSNFPHSYLSLVTSPALAARTWLGGGGVEQAT